MYQCYPNVSKEEKYDLKSVVMNSTNTIVNVLLMKWMESLSKF